MQSSIPHYTEVNFKLPDDVIGYGRLLFNSFRKHNGFNYDHDSESEELQAIHEYAAEWIKHVETEISTQNARTIQQYLEYYDCMYRIAYHAPDRTGFEDKWERMAFKKMLNGDNADPTCFMRWIYHRKDYCTASELEWYDKTLLTWKKEAIGRNQFFGYPHSLIYKIGMFLTDNYSSETGFLPDKIKSDFLKNLIQNISKTLGTATDDDLEAMFLFVINSSTADTEQLDGLITPILSRLTESTKLNRFSKEAYRLDAEYLNTL